MTTKTIDELRAEERELVARLEGIRGEIRARFHEYIDGGIKLTSRQTQVLDLLRKRFANKEIAAAMCISERAVKVHVSCLLQKFNVQTRRDLE